MRPGGVSQHKAFYFPLRGLWKDAHRAHPAKPWWAPTACSLEYSSNRSRGLDRNVPASAGPRSKSLGTFYSGSCVGTEGLVNTDSPEATC